MPDYIREEFDESRAAFRDDPDDIIHQFGTATHALLYSHLFLPDFLEVDGSILLDRGLPDTPAHFLEAKARSDVPLENIESNFNYVEVAYLFSQRQDTSGVVEIALANALVEAWRGRLLPIYPDRIFSTYIIGSDSSGSVVCVRFHELRNVELALS